LLGEEPLGQLQDARGVGDNLHGLNAGDIVKEPSAAGVHELRVALHLHELEGADLLVGRERVAGLCAEEAGDGLLAAVEQDVDIGVACGPHIGEEAAPAASVSGTRASRSSSRAWRRGARHSWLKPGLPPLQPQLERQRSTPWTQLHEVFSTISHSYSGGNCSRKLP
jgi:hypothetical protein